MAWVLVSGCYLCCHVRVLHVFLLFPLNIQRSLLTSSILPDLQPSEHGGSLRHAAVRYWDGAGTNIETQAKLGQVEFRFLSQWETGWMAGFEARSLSSESLNPLSLILALFTDSQTETKIIVHETLRSPSYNSTPSISYPHIYRESKVLVRYTMTNRYRFIDEMNSRIVVYVASSRLG